MEQDYYDTNKLVTKFLDSLDDHEPSVCLASTCIVLSCVVTTLSLRCDKESDLWETNQEKAFDRIMEVVKEICEDAKKSALV